MITGPRIPHREDWFLLFACFIITSIALSLAL